MKLPNYFLNQDLIEDDTLLKDIYYETSIDMKNYRIFDFYDSKNMKNKYTTFKMDDTNTPIFITQRWSIQSN